MNQRGSLQCIPYTIVSSSGVGHFNVDSGGIVSSHKAVFIINPSFGREDELTWIQIRARLPDHEAGPAGLTAHSHTVHRRSRT